MTTGYRKPLGDKTLEFDVARIRVLLGNLPGEAGANAWGGILVLHRDGAAVQYFPVTVAGMTAAVAAARTNDVIWVPSASLAWSGTIPASVGVSSMGHQTTFTGAITLSDDAHLEHIDVNVQSSSAGQVSGVIGPATGGAHILDCSIQARNTGAGGAVAVQDGAGGELEIRGGYMAARTAAGTACAYQVSAGGKIKSFDCEIEGISTSGSGYGGRCTDGDLYVWGGRAYGSTARFTES